MSCSFVIVWQKIGQKSESLSQFSMQGLQKLWLQGVWKWFMLFLKH